MTANIDAGLLEALAGYIAEARWFGGKGRDMRVVDVRRLGWLDPSPADGAPHTRIELARVEYPSTGPGRGPETELYQVPLAYYPDPQDRLAHALVGSWHDAELGQVHAYDAMHDRQATAQWLTAFAGRHQDEEMVFHRLEGHELDLDVHSSLFSGEQSNSTVRFGEDSLMKVFRKVTPGRNPDIEIHEALTRSGNEHVAALYGWLEAPAHDSDEPMQLAMLQQLLRTASDGWEIALASVRDLFAEADLHADEVGGDFAAEAHRLGIATAEVHDALLHEFPAETWGAEELADLGAAMRRRLDDAVAVVPGLAEHRAALEATFDELRGIDEPVPVQRVHGDYHLGQTLRTVRGWKIVDFEGEPAKPLADRIRPDTAWRDVAGMLRSFDYAAHVVEADVEEDGPQIEYRALEWASRNRSAFMTGYIEASEGTTQDGLSTVQRALLRAYEADKAVYEAVYETRNRPAWIRIPLGAIARLTEHADSTDAPAKSTSPDGPDSMEASNR
ncbi:MAG: maltokinase N-terminal cap-like domain-containing protein [Nocardioidaceae bacterium]